MKFPNNDVINSTILVITGFFFLGLLFYLDVDQESIIIVAVVGFFVIIGISALPILIEVTQDVRKYLNGRRSIK